MQSVRRIIVDCAVRMVRSQQLPAADVLPLLLQLVRTRDKALRASLKPKIISIIETLIKMGPPTAVKSVQSYLYGLVSGGEEGTSARALGLLVTLWYKGVWIGGGIAATAASALRQDGRSKVNTPLRVCAARFFLGDNPGNEEEDSDDGSDEEDWVDAGLMAGGGRKGAGAAKAISSALSKRKRNSGGGGADPGRVMMYLRDPQSFAEGVLVSLRRSNERLEVKLLLMRVLCDCVAQHELLVPNMYEYLSRYIKPRQRSVTSILAAVAGSLHAGIPQDAVSPVIRMLCDEFVSDGRSREIMAVGLNAVRELCARQPDAVTPELLSDLVEYVQYRDKGVALAARSLISLYRSIDPTRLPKRKRGRFGDAVETAIQRNTAFGSISGIDLLEANQMNGSDGESCSEDFEAEGAGEAADGSASDIASDEEWEDESNSEDSGESVDPDGSDSDGEEESVPGGSASVAPSVASSSVPLDHRRSLTNSEFRVRWVSQ